MKKGIIKNLTIIVILSLGLILVLVSLLLEDSGNKKIIFLFSIDNAKLILLSIGCSIIAGGIIGLINNRHLEKYKKGLQILNYWGLSNIYETRQQMNQESNKLISNAKEMDIAAFGLRGLINYQGPIIRQQIRNGLQLRILAPRPDSEFVKQREKDENCSEGEIIDSIRKLIIWVKESNNQYPEMDPPIQIKHYDALPLDSYMRIDRTLFIGPFMVNKRSQLTIAYEFRSNTKGFDYYNKYFDDLWNNAELTRDAI